MEERIFEMGRIRARLYRKAIAPIAGRWLARVRDQHGECEGWDLERPKSRVLIWFHAASVGELETLWSVIMAALESGSDAIVTVFSSSASNQVERLVGEAAGKAGRVLRYGYSPAEGNWGVALGKARPNGFVTAKYEAWPELWASLSEHGIPLMIVGARSRTSLKVGKVVCTAILGARLPKMNLCVFASEDVGELSRLFPEAEILVTGDPRWDRVRERVVRGSRRVLELLGALGSLPRPWGVLGSVWEPDLLKAWKGNWNKVRGTVWVVPHRVERGYVERLVARLREEGLSPARSSLLPGEAGATPREPKSGRLSRGIDCVVVDETGFLSELYARADWAYVGGGFGPGSSMHSTIEPAICGVPIACGSKGEGQFSEIGQLVGSGQLTLIRDANALARWLETALSATESEARARWRSEAEARLGASRRVLERLSQIVNPAHAC